YTATLSNKAGTDVTLKLDNGSTITIKAGDTVGTVWTSPLKDRTPFPP
ncbi:TPA: immunoglobulin-like domain-containing protein, partial [Staphylococcus aureus]